MPRVPSAIARSLEPLIHSLWLLFIVWTVIVAGLWLGAERWLSAISNPGLRAAALALNHGADILWLLLATANLYLHLAEKEGLARARSLAALIVGVSAAVAVGSAWTGYPLGTVFYTTHLGPKLGPVPFGWPLLWFVVVMSSRSLAARFFPRASHDALALITGACALLTDLNLETVAVKFRLYWLWYVAGTHVSSPPLWRNYAVWFIGAAALAWFAREHRVAPPAHSSWHPSAVVVIFNALLLLGHLRLALGS